VLQEADCERVEAEALTSTSCQSTAHHNKLHPTATHNSVTLPFEHSARHWNRTDTDNGILTADCYEQSQQYSNKDSLFHADHRRLFPGVISRPLSSAFDNDVPPDTRSYHPAGALAGTVGDSKPIGFVPAVQGTTKNQVETATAEAVSEDGSHDDAAAAAAAGSKLTTTARVQPSSTFQRKQQVGTARTTAGTSTTTSASEHSKPSGTDQRADDLRGTTDQGPPRPPLMMMPGYPPVPWGPMPPVPPPYPGAPYPPYSYYPPWPPYFAGPVPMMPMMPHPMMPMVPMPYWMPPAMHPGMRIRHSLVPTTSSSAVTSETTDKTEVSQAQT